VSFGLFVNSEVSHQKRCHENVTLSCPTVKRVMHGMLSTPCIAPWLSNNEQKRSNNQHRPTVKRVIKRCLLAPVYEPLRHKRVNNVHHSYVTELSPLTLLVRDRAQGRACQTLTTLTTGSTHGSRLHTPSRRPTGRPTGSFGGDGEGHPEVPVDRRD